MESDIMQEAPAEKKRPQEALNDERLILLDTPVNQTLLTRLRDKRTVQPQFDEIVERLYTALTIEAMNRYFPVKMVTMETPMVEYVGPDAEYTVDVVDPETPVAVVNVLRGGDLPSQVVQRVLGTFGSITDVQRHFINIKRQTTPNHQVIGAEVKGAANLGPVHNRIVLAPDPMGATGGTLCELLDAYRREGLGEPAHFVALQLVVTLRHVKRVLERFPKATIITMAVDPGLTDKSYIYPGLGDFGARSTGIA